MQTTIKLSYNSDTYGSVNVENFLNNEYIHNVSHLVDIILPQVYVNANDIEKCNDVLPIITYLAEYCVFSTLKHIKCKSLFSKFNSRKGHGL